MLRKHLSVSRILSVSRRRKWERWTKHIPFFFLVKKGVYVYFWRCCTACSFLVPQPGIKPVPPAVEAWSLNHWTTREVPDIRSNSVLILSAQSQHALHRTKDSVSSECPPTPETSDTKCKSRLSPVLRTNQLYITGSHTSSSVPQFARTAHGTQENSLLTVSRVLMSSSLRHHGL